MSEYPPNQGQAYESLYPTSGQQAPEASEQEGAGKVQGIVDNIHYRTKEALTKVPVIGAVQKVIEHPKVRNRVEGVKGLIGATAVVPFNPIRSSVEQGKALKQIVTGKEEIIAPPREILRSTATGLLKTAKGAAKMSLPLTNKRAAAKEIASGVREVVTGNPGDQGDQNQGGTGSGKMAA